MNLIAHLPALEALVGWANSVQRRVGVQMGDANTGALQQARLALGLDDG